MHRRSVLTLIGTALAGAALHRPIAFPTASTHPSSANLRFFVAGVRFLKGAPKPRRGDPAILRRETFRGETAYAILTASGEKVGYVPRPLVPRIDGRDVAHCTFYEVTRYAVPWKRYELIARFP